MTQLKEFPWWPTIWSAEKGNDPTPAEIAKHGVLKNVRRVSHTLTLVIDHKGVICTAIIVPNVCEDILILLRHILLQHCGESIELVEKIEFDLQSLFSVVK
jgi:hypothetical protein